jgi:hypothetical protein
MNGMETDLGEKGKKSGLAGTLALIRFPKLFTDEGSASVPALTRRW